MNEDFRESRQQESNGRNQKEAARQRANKKTDQKRVRTGAASTNQQPGYPSTLGNPKRPAHTGYSYMYRYKTNTFVTYLRQYLH
jgi:hypothetical protein